MFMVAHFDGKDKYRKREITRNQFFEVLVDVTKEKRGRVPSHRVMHRRLRALGYSLSLSSVQRHMEKLEWPDRRLTRDKDYDLIINHSEWKLLDSPDDSPEQV